MQHRLLQRHCVHICHMIIEWQQICEEKHSQSTSSQMNQAEGATFLQYCIYQSNKQTYVVNI